MHKLKKTLAAICLLTPVAAGALGVGEINLQSALNQKLRAEIPLISSGAEDASNVRISLASPSAFAKAGIERFYFLNSLRFKPLSRPDGSLVVEVTSNESIREPFLNFLVEVQWPNGRMLREFTVLLDPPSMLADGTIPEQSVAPVAAKPNQQEVESVTAVAASAAKNVAEQTVVESLTEVSDRAAAVDVSSTSSGGEYGPVSGRDSIWKIAKRVNPDSRIVTHEQMMMALYRSNPQAFYRKNVSALKAGAVLAIPEQEAILNISRRDARVAFAQQTESWNVTTGKIVAKGKTTDTKKLASQATGQGVKTDKATGQLELLSAAKDPVSGKVDVQQNSALLAEARETLVQENEELRSRVVDLENQVKTVERLLALKDEQLASLQNQLQEKTASVDVKQAEQAIRPDSEVTKDGAADEAIKTTKTTVQDEPGEAVQPEGSEAITPADSVEPEKIAEQSAAESVTTETQEGGVTADEPAEAPVEATVAPAEPVVTSVVEPVETEQPVRDDSGNNETTGQSLISEFLSEPMYPAAAGIGVVLLGLLAFAFSRKRKADDDDEEQADIITAPENLSDSLLDEDELLAKEIDQASSDDFAQSNLEEETFLSEFAASDLSTLDTDDADENDPISEADVYLAYGRHQQAEDLIRTALNKEPSNEDYKLKLLEIHAAADNQEAFDAYSRELHDSNPKPEFWQKVVAIGTPYSPQNSLFGGEVDTIESDISAISEMDVLQAEGAVDANAETSVQTEGDDAFEFDLTEAYGELPASELETESQLSSAEEVSLDFDALSEQSLMSDGVTEGDKSELSELKASAADDLDFDMTFINEDTQLGGDTTESSLSSLSPASEMVDFDLDSLTMPSEESEISTLGEVSDEFQELTDMDEVETKLDLAKAYVDMEDKESAKEILDDVLGKGSDAQKQEAEQLIKKLASN